MRRTYEQVEELPGPWERVFRAQQDALARLPRFTVLAADPTTGRIAATKGLTLYSWGFTIVVDVGHVDADRSVVRVWSESHSLGAPRRWHRSHVDAIFRTIRSELGLPTETARKR